MNSDLLFPSLGSLEDLRPHFPSTLCPWTWLTSIAAALREMENSLGLSDTEMLFVHHSAQVDPSARIAGPALIGPGCRIGPGAFVRENVICGNYCTIGHGCEVKNSLLLDGATVAHRNYVGDSILGRGAHLGAGAVLANLRLDGENVRFQGPDGPEPTELRKCGSFLGDDAQVGCNAVLHPGTVLGQRAWVHATVAFSGYLAAKCEAVPAKSPVLRLRKFPDGTTSRDGVGE
ncbi:MAG: UDP-N-acetylglucosamine diphosphorylase [Puniceicoccales bacterium]|jgi:NDP-sugar pyrophosphorylase family protein|nr:UDP-N-acetylglucosamine diphosphorylase [Puniceicoccales bacterium]